MRRWFAGPRRLMLKARFGARGVATFAREKALARRPTLPLEQVQRRLELLILALYAQPIPITPSTGNERHWTERFRAFLSRDPRAGETTASTNSGSIQLPIRLSARDGVDGAIARYRLLAIEQAERIARGTAAHVPERDRLERDLFLIREGAVVDAEIARAHPGMTIALDAERNDALERRPALDKLTPSERAVELLLRGVLSKEDAHDDGEHESSDAASSLEWAKTMATEIRHHPGAYRGIPPASFWGTMRVIDDATNEQSTAAPSRAQAPISSRTSPTGRNVSASGGGREDPSDKDDNDPESESESKNPEGASEGGATKDDGDNEEGGSRDDRGAGGQGQGIGGNSRASSMTFTDEEPLTDLPPGIPYDEWDCDVNRYIPRAAMVRLYESNEGDLVWSRNTLTQHAALVRRIRHHFEPLRARRALLRQQRAGDDLDIVRCVNAIVDRRIGQVPDERLYLDARPARRGVAIALLVDVSGSTETRVAGDLRIIDLEKIALLLAGEALDAIGDLYAIYAFSGQNAYNVKLTTIKDFGDRNDDAVRRRKAALEPGGSTRLGAAVRHSTRQLARQSAGHRLLLILSDGRPHDIDKYDGTYGVEDSRQAIMEARASGVFPFCLTVDADASEYLPRIFGSAGHRILQRPEQLPQALLRAVHALIRRR
jgi:nitric oxide reductase NorD protein